MSLALLELTSLLFLHCGCQVVLPHAVITLNILISSCLYPLVKLKQLPTCLPQQAPLACTIPTSLQCATSDYPTLLNKNATTHVQGISGTFLAYARDVYRNILPTLDEIFNQQVKPTEKTVYTFKQLVAYSSTHLKAVIWFHASDMILSPYFWCILFVTSWCQKPLCHPIHTIQYFHFQSKARVFQVSQL